MLDDVMIMQILFTDPPKNGTKMTGGGSLVGSNMS
jgi:hypothetical protein